MTVQALRNPMRAPGFWNGLGRSASWVRSKVDRETLRRSAMPIVYCLIGVYVLAQLWSPLGTTFRIGWLVLPYVPMTLLAVSALLLGWERYEAEQSGVALHSTWLFARRVWCFAVIYIIGTLTLLNLQFSPWFLGALAVCGLVAVINARVEPPAAVRKDPLRRPAQIISAFTTAGVLKPDTNPNITFQGSPHVDEHGSTRHVGIKGKSWRDVLAKSASIAAAFEIPEELLSITHSPDQDAHIFTIRIRHRDAPAIVPVLSQRSALVSVERTSWTSPIRIGFNQDTREPVYVETFENNIALAGIPGFGKTSTAFGIVAHFLLDPTTTIYGADGKGSKADYGKIAPLCERWVWGGSNPKAADELEDMLKIVLDVIHERNTSLQEDEWPGLLVLLEEFQELRAACADNAQVEKIDDLKARIIRLGRAVSVVMLFSTQLPQVNDFPSRIRNLVSQNISMVTRGKGDHAIALGVTNLGDLQLPQVRGEALFANRASVSRVALDYLKREDVAIICERATLLRSGAGAVKMAGALMLVADPEDPLTLHRAITAGLADGPLPATELLSVLPVELRPVNAISLGKLLNSHPNVERVSVNRVKVWRLLPGIAPGVRRDVIAPLSVAGTSPDAPDTDERELRAYAEQ